MIKIIWCTSAVLLFLGALSMPSGYYDLLRIIIFGTSAYAAFTNFSLGKNNWLISFGIIALIFNPFMPLYLYDKLTWVIIDCVSGVCFLINLRKIKE